MASGSGGSTLDMSLDDVIKNARDKGDPDVDGVDGGKRRKFGRKGRGKGRERKAGAAEGGEGIERGEGAGGGKGGAAKDTNAAATASGDDKKDKLAMSLDDVIKTGRPQATRRQRASKTETTDGPQGVATNLGGRQRKNRALAVAAMMLKLKKDGLTSRLQQKVQERAGARGLRERLRAKAAGRGVKDFAAMGRGRLRGLVQGRSRGVAGEGWRAAALAAADFGLEAEGAFGFGASRLPRRGGDAREAIAYAKRRLRDRGSLYEPLGKRVRSRGFPALDYEDVEREFRGSRAERYYEEAQRQRYYDEYEPAAPRRLGESRRDGHRERRGGHGHREEPQAGALARGCRIRVEGVPRDLTSADIKEAFEDNGYVTRCILDAGTAWITYANPRDAKKAAHTFDRGELNGKTIYVHVD